MRATFLALSVVAVALGGGTALGQVAPTQTGRHLDVNLQVGSGGYNSVVQSSQINSQLYVSGQVTGLGGFHGNVGYVAGNELRIALPSEDLDSFRARSVGLGQIARGGTFRTEAFYRRTATAMGVGDLLAGRTAPGTNMPLTSRGEPAVVRRLYDEATAGYAGLMARPIGQADLTSRAGERGLADLSPGAGIGDVRVGRFVSPDAGGYGFALQSLRDRTALADDLQALHRVDGSVGAAVDARVDGSAGTGRGGVDDPSLPPLPGKDRDDERTRGGRAETGMPAANEDVFMDLLVRLRQQRAGQVGPTPPPGNAANRPDGPIVQLADKNTIVLSGFAGRGRDLFNVHMKQARQYLREGKFYRAAGRYELAAVANRRNPLARMGLCVAHFCAGEPLTASLHLKRAFAMFPALMATGLDVKGMVGPTVLRHRLNALDKRVARHRGENERAEADKRMLTLLLTFVHKNAGNADAAKRGALELKSIAKGDKVLTAYATFVLTGKLPRSEPPPGKKPK